MFGSGGTTTTAARIVVICGTVAGLHASRLWASILQLQAQGVDVRIEETDATNATNATGYPTELEDFIDERIFVGIKPRYPKWRESFEIDLPAFDWRPDVKSRLSEQVLHPVVPRLPWVGPARNAGLDIRLFYPRRMQ